MKQFPMNRFAFLRIATAAFGMAASAFAADEAVGPKWWNEAWTQRQPLTLDTGEVSGEVGDEAVLIRLFDAGIFAGAREDGSDLRFVTEDGTVLAHQIEGYDPLLSEGFVWVKIPDLKGASKTTIYAYFGNQDPAMPAAGAASEIFADKHAAVFHFAERGGIPSDSTAGDLKAEAPSMTAEGALIGNGLRLIGNNPVVIPGNDRTAWTDGQPHAISLWVKHASLQQNAVLLSRTEGDTSFRLLLDQGMPVVEIKGGSAPFRTQPAAPLPDATWSHIVVSAEGGNVNIIVNGEPYGTAAGSFAPVTGSIVVGALAVEESGVSPFIGDIDELRFYNSALSPAAAKFLYVNEGNSAASQAMLTLGPVEGGEHAGGHSGMMEHVMLFGDIAKNMMFDGWIAIGVCCLMIAVGWTVAIRKFFYLNKIEKGNKEFLEQWKKVSTDLTAINPGDKKNVKSLGGKITEEEQELLEDAPLYHLYHIGAEEISHRLDKLDEKIGGLPGRSIHAIRAALDSGMVHENHRLTDGLVFLTISIAGGPYVGLLGTVVGVMITFAIIAKSGEVNVNSIAPGIASALLATVVGLIVAIPALFIYSYLNGRIKNVVANMQVFIDEFVAKMAELYRPANEA
jgi:biopolymer transport protein ExbB